MIISNLTGGLGNQLFQYAFGRYLSHKLKTSFKYHFTNSIFNTKRDLLINRFNISALPATNKDLWRFRLINNEVLIKIISLLDERFQFKLNNYIITQKFPYSFDQNQRHISDNKYIHGYFNDNRYFKGIEKILRKEFILKDELDAKNLLILKKIRSNNSVSIHVRRGDLVNNALNSMGVGFIGIEYYINSIQRINKHISNPFFYIFSDDIAWCKKNFYHLIKNSIYISHNQGKNSCKDIALMSACKHNIIANSTFSWWGAWLNSNKRKIVISPSNFMRKYA